MTVNKKKIELNVWSLEFPWSFLSNFEKLNNISDVGIPTTIYTMYLNNWHNQQNNQLNF